MAQVLRHESDQVCQIARRDVKPLVVGRATRRARMRAMRKTVRRVSSGSASSPASAYAVWRARARARGPTTSPHVGAAAVPVPARSRVRRRRRRPTAPVDRTRAGDAPAWVEPTTARARRRIR